MGHRVWRVVGAVVAALGGAMSGAAPATADVTVIPAQAVRGGAVKLTFRVPEDRAPAYTTRVEVRLPEATPIAETYPMSVPGWAPRVATRTLAQPLAGPHGGRTAEVVAGITWVRAEGAPRSAGPAELTISLGPLPETDRLVFTVRQTYSDGVVTDWAEVARSEGGTGSARPAPVLTLLPAEAEVSPAGPHPGAGAPEAGRAGDDSDGLGWWTVGSTAGLVAAAAAVGVWLGSRRRVSGPRPRQRGRGWRLRE